jgi:hypothetical protein
MAIEMLAHQARTKINYQATDVYMEEYCTPFIRLQSIKSKNNNLEIEQLILMEILSN